MFGILKRIYDNWVNSLNRFLDDILDDIHPDQKKEMNKFFVKCYSMGFKLKHAQRMWNYHKGVFNQDEKLYSLSVGLFRQSPLLLYNMGLSANKIKELTEPHAKYKIVYCDIFEKEFTNRTVSQDDYTNVVLDYLEEQKEVENE